MRVIFLTLAVSLVLDSDDRRFCRGGGGGGGYVRHCVVVCLCLRLSVRICLCVSL